MACATIRSHCDYCGEWVVYAQQCPHCSAPSQMKRRELEELNQLRNKYNRLAHQARESELRAAKGSWLSRWFPFFA